MMLFCIIAIIVILTFLSIQIFSFFALLAGSIYENDQHEHVPKVSLLLAARNEEKLILRSLKAISELDYPKDKIEVLIGNDESTDNTLSLIEDFIKDKSHFQVHTITKTLGNGRGKANVLAHLAKKANGEFYFITDVDVQLPSAWIKEMLAKFTPEVGILSGTTMCDSEPSMFAKMQAIDWLHFMGYIKSFGNKGIASTSVGNNMAVRASAYWETGGFEKIEFSITEDYKLFEAVTSNGWEWRTLLGKGSLGKAYYIPELTEMLHQRKRWLIGAKDLPPLWKFLLILYGSAYPVILVGILMTDYAWMFFLFWLIKFLIQSIFIQKLAVKVGESKFNLIDLIQYEIYVFINTVITGIFYFLPLKSKWKGRTYNKAYIK